MISYRTFVFGTIAVMAAAAPALPAYADSGAAVPSPIRTTMDSGAAVPGPVHTMDSGAAVPGPIHTMDSGAAVPKAVTTGTTQGFVNTLFETFVQFEEFVLRISL
ncbi:MAG TPA: hypothetical protein VJP85_00710 [Candidatus Baltobacteraceae bacterium]|nr:hypothetical protein [Candidatus Baltobacteraceae bacterium]